MKPNQDLFRELSEQGFSLVRLHGKDPSKAEGGGWQRWCAEWRLFDEIGFRPEHNAGIACGPASGVLVLDVDDLSMWSKQNFELPRTFTVKTGRDCFHYYFKYPDNGKEYKNRSRKKRGFDIRGLGGQVVAPGSIHPDTGKPYVIENDVPIVDAPQWLLRLAVEEPRQSTTIRAVGGEWGGDIDKLPISAETKYLITDPQPVGTRSEAIMSVLNALVWSNLTDSDIFSIFETYPIGDKYREKRQTRERWLQPQIDKAREHVTDRADQVTDWAIDHPAWEVIDGGEGKKKQSQASMLVDLAKDAALFHTPDNDCYAKVGMGHHVEVWHLRSKGFKRWLGNLFHAEKGKSPSAQAISDALLTLEGIAQFQGPEEEVHVRLAQQAENVYLDLANAAWEAVEISPGGWRIVENPPVNFRRPKGLSPLPRPVDGDLDLLRPLVNLSGDEGEGAWILMVAWLIQALHPEGPYPVLVLHGEQGSAKSTTARFLRSIVDPSTVPLRTLPRNERDLAISANNSWIISLDNISSLKVWLSDAICRLSTGGGFSTRELFTDGEEVLFEATRPVIVNGIDEMVSRHDLADRSIFLTLGPIAKNKRVPEARLVRQFEGMSGRILGGALTAVGESLKNLPNTELAEIPRMADFAMRIEAAESVLPWKRGDFLRAYNRNRRMIVHLALEGDIVANAILELMEEREMWEGAAADLLVKLESIVPETVVRSKPWPKAANALSRRITRISSFLRRAGIEIERDEPRGRSRSITIRKYVQNTVHTVHTGEAQETSGSTSDDIVDDINDKPQYRPEYRPEKDERYQQIGRSDDMDDKKRLLSGDDCNGCPHFYKDLYREACKKTGKDPEHMEGCPLWEEAATEAVKSITEENPETYTVSIFDECKFCDHIIISPGLLRCDLADQQPIRGLDVCPLEVDDV